MTCGLYVEFDLDSNLENYICDHGVLVKTYVPLKHFVSSMGLKRSDRIELEIVWKPWHYVGKYLRHKFWHSAKFL